MDEQASLLTGSEKAGLNWIMHSARIPSASTGDKYFFCFPRDFSLNVPEYEWGCIINYMQVLFMYMQLEQDWRAHVHVCIVDAPNLVVHPGMSM